MTREKREYNRQYYLKNRARFLAGAAAYRESHREEIRVWMRKYYRTEKGLARIKADRKNNRARNTVYMKEWNKRRSPDQLTRALELQRKYVRNNLEKHRIRGSNWRRANKEKASKSQKASLERWKARDPIGYRMLNVVLAHRRRAKILSVSDGTVTVQAIQEMFLQFRHCPYCGIDLIPSNRHLDHKDPLSRGGLHTITNLIPCCKSCNHKKSSKPYEKWLAEIGRQAL